MVVYFIAYGEENTLKNYSRNEYKYFLNCCSKFNYEVCTVTSYVLRVIPSKQKRTDRV
jgi:hypothetical protein